MTFAARFRDRLGPLSEGPFRMLWLGQTTSAVGDAMIPVAIAFAVLALGGGAGAIGLVLVAFSVPRLVLILAGGVWADRLPRQRVMLAADVVRGAVETLLAILLLSHVAELWHLAAVAAVVGAASAFFVPASTGLIPQVLKPERLRQGNALMGLSRNATGVIGPSVAGLLVATVGVGWVFVLDAATFVASGVSLVLLRVPKPAAPSERRPFLAELAGGWREVTSRTWLWSAITAFGITNLCSAAFYVLGPVIAEEALGGATSWGLIVTAQAVGGLAGGLIALRWRPARPIAVAFILGPLFFLPHVALAVPLIVPLIMVGSVVSLAAMELTNTWWYTVLQQQVPPAALSRVSSYDWLVSLVFQPLGFALVGPIALQIGATATLLGAAALGAGVSLAALSVRSVRTIGWREPSAGTGAGEPPGSGPMAINEGPVAGSLEPD